MTTASRTIAHSLLAAAWRENLHHLRDHAHTTPTHIRFTINDTTITVKATHKTFAQIQPEGPIYANNTIIDDPAALLHLLAPEAPDQLAEELTDAHIGLTLAQTRYRQRNAELATIAAQNQTTTTLDVAHHLQHADSRFLPCRLFEPLAVNGHHLHPCARTRLGWTHTDRQQYDLESTNPLSIRFISADPAHVTATPDEHGNHLGTHLQRLHPHLDVPHDRILIPVHPWQYDNVVRPGYRHLFDNDVLTPHPELTVDAYPTTSIRTLITPTGHYLKCSLSIHITSTNRGISPATAHNGPVLSRTLTHIITNDQVLHPRISVLPEPAAVSLPESRDLTCILRGNLHPHTTTDTIPIPATALPARSPISDLRIITELADTHGDPTDFLRRYTDLLLTATLHLAGTYGIAAEAHLQNCVPTFRHGTPQHLILRDLGGTRILTTRLHHTGHHPPLHPESVITTQDPDTMRAKLAYTALQNHLPALIDALAHDNRLQSSHAWDIIANTIANTDMPDADRAFYTAATVPHKALLTMRITGANDHYTAVPNPLATP